MVPNENGSDFVVNFVVLQEFHLVTIFRELMIKQWRIG